jgi:hypothetical protein
VTAISAAMLAVVAARAVAAGRELTGAEPLYLRAPDVTLPKSVTRPGVEARMTLRDADLDDLADIMDLERASFPTDAWSEPMMRELSRPTRTTSSTSRRGGCSHTAGCAPSRAPPMPTSRRSPSPRPRGAAGGADLLRALLRQRGSAGRARCSSRCVPTTRPPPRCTSRRVPRDRASRYYQPDDVDAVVMKLDLVAWAAERHAQTPIGECAHDRS